MDRMTKKIIGAFSAIVVVAAVILVGYYAIIKQAKVDSQENILPTTEVGKILAKDLETKYPETPTEVLKLYWRINCCLYNNENLSDEEIKSILKQLRNLYDEELLAESKNDFDSMYSKLKKEREQRIDQGQVFGSYIVQKNNTLEVSDLNGADCTTVTTSTLIKAKGDVCKIYENFICRQASDGKWKILGWKKISKEDASEVDIE